MLDLLNDTAYSYGEADDAGEAATATHTLYTHSLDECRILSITGIVLVTRMRED